MEGNPTQVLSAFGETGSGTATPRGAHDTRAGVLDRFRARFESGMQEEYSLTEYLELCRNNPAVYATAAERMLMAIGEPELRRHPQRPAPLAHLRQPDHRAYPAFREFYGMEEAIEQIVAFFKHAAQGLEERKQILYLLGPVGGGKSSLAERLKAVMEQMPVLRAQGLAGQRVAARPVRARARTAPSLEDEYGIPRRYLNRHHVAVGGQAPRRNSAATSRKFRVVQLQSVGAAPDRRSPRPSRATRTTRTSRRWSARSTSASSSTISQNDPDAYSYSGGLCLANQGLLEFVEMFKAPIKMLHPLLTATQEGNFKGTEGFGAIPFNGIILAHSNESEWQSFRNNKNNEAFLDRIYIVKVPVLPARVRGGQDLREAARRNSSLAERAVRAGHARDDGAVLGADAPEGAGELEHLLQDARLRRREPEGRRSRRPRRCRSTATTPASTRA